MAQIGFESLAYSSKRRRTGRETVSVEMDAVVAWRQPLDRIDVTRQLSLTLLGKRN